MSARFLPPPPGQEKAGTSLPEKNEEDTLRRPQYNRTLFNWLQQSCYGSPAEAWEAAGASAAVLNRQQNHKALSQGAGGPFAAGKAMSPEPLCCLETGITWVFQVFPQLTLNIILQ